MLQNRSDALKLLNELGAPNRLVQHAQAVGDAAEVVSHRLKALGVACDFRLIEVGSILHDAGKIQHPRELSEPGSLHEQAGQALLLLHGVPPELAGFCISHAAWKSPTLSFEERVVALADKLWKGKREADLELAVIDEVAARLAISRWDVFELLDSTFENIAATAAERLEQSRLP